MTEVEAMLLSFQSFFLAAVTLVITFIFLHVCRNSSVFLFSVTHNARIVEVYITNTFCHNQSKDNKTRFIISEMDSEEKYTMLLTNAVFHNCTSRELLSLFRSIRKCID